VRRYLPTVRGLQRLGCWLNDTVLTLLFCVVWTVQSHHNRCTSTFARKLSTTRNTQHTHTAAVGGRNAFATLFYIIHHGVFCLNQTVTMRGNQTNHGHRHHNRRNNNNASVVSMISAVHFAAVTTKMAAFVVVVVALTTTARWCSCEAFAPPPQFFYQRSSSSPSLLPHTHVAVATTATAAKQSPRGDSLLLTLIPPLHGNRHFQKRRSSSFNTNALLETTSTSTTTSPSRAKQQFLRSFWSGQRGFGQRTTQQPLKAAALNSNSGAAAVGYDPLNNRHSASDWLYNVRSLPQSKVLREIRNPVLAVAAWSASVSILHALLKQAGWTRWAAHLCIPGTAHSFLVSALGLLLVFRTNSAYQRFNVRAYRTIRVCV
jgi:Bestrophin, RFP-TM, chloride channel